MASENKNENVLLKGEIGYFKKTGSMNNYGVVNTADINTSYSYPDGFIDVGSTIMAAKIEETVEYRTCESNMKSYLGSNWEEPPAGTYSIVHNMEKMYNMLNPVSQEIATIASRF